MAKKTNVLIICAPIKSHLIPSFYLSRKLSKECNVRYLINESSLETLVSNNGFEYIYSPAFMNSGDQSSEIFGKRNKSFIYRISRLIKRSFLKKQVSIIEDIFLEYPAEVILIDVFMSFSVLPIKLCSSKTRCIYINPMMSTYVVPGYPSVSEGFWDKDVRHSSVEISKQSNNGFILTNFIEEKVKYFYNRALLNSLGLRQVRDTLHTTLYEDIDEIILAPEKFELTTQIVNKRQFYLGLCVDVAREEQSIDSSFHQKFEEVVSRKDNLGKSLVYCSFGTFYDGSFSRLLRFVQVLIEAVRTLDHIELVLSINKLIMETVDYQIVVPANVTCFERVPQLVVLQHMDLFITHGGLGSVKESIYYHVPMLVYPLDLRYDQNGNGLKVTHHGLGERGVLETESSIQLREKIIKVLSDKRYFTNVQEFSLSTESQSSIDSIIDKVILENNERVGS
ncbi:nucleotide disphospho-sugar-binding domain-containing protein [Dyadobacter endophyticus]|uniref:nucleotide disphospho-sugar-binding domain-containing protein n=1 Tax=Dyadobacter TaxID=120831 RepID=UPI003CF7E768